MKVKTSELEDSALDWAVAKVEGGEYKPHQFGENIDAPFLDAVVFPDGRAYSCWSPSTKWSQCGPLIEKHQVEFCIADGFGVCANIRYSDKSECHFDGYLIAACRAIVASVLGDEIEIPDELIGA